MKCNILRIMYLVLATLIVPPHAFGNVFLDFSSLPILVDQSYGDNAWADVSYRQVTEFGNENTLELGFLAVWEGEHPNSYGNLVNVVWGSSSNSAHVAEIKFESKTANFLTLNSFDAAAWFPNGTASIRSFRVYDGNYNSLFELNSFPVTHTSHNTISPNVSAHTLILQWDYAFHVALDNIFVTVAPGPSSVEGSFVNHVGFGGVGSALDTGKQLAKEGPASQLLTYTNLINTTRGINGLVFDIANLPGTPTSADFEFQMSPKFTFDQGLNPPSGWGAAPAPTSVSVIASTPSRVVIQWADNAIANRWLRVTVKANANTTGLAAPEVYYLGHLLGETTGGDGLVFSISFGSDLIPIRAALAQNVNSSSSVDIDKNGLIQVADIIAMRTNTAKQLTQITIPVAGGGG